MAIRDKWNALRRFVLDDTDIFDLTGGRVYINRIPESVIEDQDPREPAKMLVLRQAGGSAKADLLPLETANVTALCYGETDFEADKLLRALTELFLYAKREIVDGVLLHHFNATGGVTPLVDPDIVWPAVAQDFSFVADTKEA